MLQPLPPSSQELHEQEARELSVLLDTPYGCAPNATTAEPSARKQQTLPSKDDVAIVPSETKSAVTALVKADPSSCSKPSASNVEIAEADEDAEVVTSALSELSAFFRPTTQSRKRASAGLGSTSASVSAGSSSRGRGQLDAKRALKQRRIEDFDHAESGGGIALGDGVEFAAMDGGNEDEGLNSGRPESKHPPAPVVAVVKEARASAASGKSMTETSAGIMGYFQQPQVLQSLRQWLMSRIRLPTASKPMPMPAKQSKSSIPLGSTGGEAPIIQSAWTVRGWIMPVANWAASRVPSIFRRSLTGSKRRKVTVSVTVREPVHDRVRTAQATSDSDATAIPSDTTSGVGAASVTSVDGAGVHQPALPTESAVNRVDDDAKLVPAGQAQSTKRRLKLNKPPVQPAVHANRIRTNQPGATISTSKLSAVNNDGVTSAAETRDAYFSRWMKENYPAVICLDRAKPHSKRPAASTLFRPQRHQARRTLTYSAVYAEASPPRSAWLVSVPPEVPQQPQPSFLSRLFAEPQVNTSRSHHVPDRQGSVSDSIAAVPASGSSERVTADQTITSAAASGKDDAASTRRKLEQAERIARNRAEAMERLRKSKAVAGAVTQAGTGGMLHGPALSKPVADVSDRGHVNPAAAIKGTAAAAADDEVVTSKMGAVQSALSTSRAAMAMTLLADLDASVFDDDVTLPPRSSTVTPHVRETGGVAGSTAGFTTPSANQQHSIVDHQSSHSLDSLETDVVRPPVPTITSVTVPRSVRTFLSGVSSKMAAPLSSANSTTVAAGAASSGVSNLSSSSTLAGGDSQSDVESISSAADSVPSAGGSSVRLWGGARMSNTAATLTATPRVPAVKPSLATPGPVHTPASGNVVAPMANSSATKAPSSWFNRPAVVAPSSHAAMIQDSSRLGKPLQTVEAVMGPPSASVTDGGTPANPAHRSPSTVTNAAVPVLRTPTASTTPVARVTPTGKGKAQEPLSFSSKAKVTPPVAGPVSNSLASARVVTVVDISPAAPPVARYVLRTVAMVLWSFCS